MKRELGIGSCGLACCLCSENVTCGGCNSGSCPDAAHCENRACSIAKQLSHCYACGEPCRTALSMLEETAENFVTITDRFGGSVYGFLARDNVLYTAYSLYLTGRQELAEELVRALLADL